MRTQFIEFLVLPESDINPSIEKYSFNSVMNGCFIKCSRSYKLS